ncbi:hypothetical protein AAC387_Pa09g1037 [Persea americana]
MVAVVGPRDALEAATVAVVIASLVEIGPEEVGAAIVFEVGIKLEAEVFDEMVSADAPVRLSTACELFIMELT